MAADTLSYKTTSIGTPDAAYVHGFTFSIKADTISPANETVPKTFTGDFYLYKLTLRGRKEIRWPVSYKLMVMEPENNTIIGLSNESQTTTSGNGKQPDNAPSPFSLICHRGSRRPLFCPNFHHNSSSAILLSLQTKADL